MDKQTKKAKTERAAENLHSGHRERMFAKLYRGGLCEHELLETLLFFAIPRRNTNDIAHRLIQRFGSVGGVFNASLEELELVKGMGKNSTRFIQCVGAILRECKTSIQRDLPTYYNIQEFAGYVKVEYADKSKEVMDVYLLNDEMKIFMRRRFLGDEDSVTVLMKWVQKLLVDCTPTGIVVVHNHPVGSSQPSIADRIAAEKFQTLCMQADVLLCDFCIYSPEGVLSYYRNGELRRVANAVIAHNNRARPMVDMKEEL